MFLPHVLSYFNIADVGGAFVCCGYVIVFVVVGCGGCNRIYDAHMCIPNELSCMLCTRGKTQGFLRIMALLIYVYKMALRLQDLIYSTNIPCLHG